MATAEAPQTPVVQVSDGRFRGRTEPGRGGVRSVVRPAAVRPAGAGGGLQGPGPGLTVRPDPRPGEAVPDRDWRQVRNLRTHPRQNLFTAKIYFYKLFRGSEIKLKQTKIKWSFGKKVNIKVERWSEWGMRVARRCSDSLKNGVFMRL